MKLTVISALLASAAHGVKINNQGPQQLS